MSDVDNTPRSRLRCSEIMTTSVTTAGGGSSLKEVAGLMRDGDMGAVPVIENGRLAGIVTDRDIVVRGIAEGVELTAPISTVMTRDLFTVGPEDFAFEAIRLMGDKQVRRIPVINTEGELKGIISMADVALETEDQREIAETLEEISSGSSFWSKS